MIRKSRTLKFSRFGVRRARELCSNDSHRWETQLLIEELENRTLLSFMAPANYDTGGRPAALAVGDFRGNHIPDLVTANASTGTVSILLGNGDGTFRPPVNYSVGTNPVAVVVADLARNGILDIVTAGSSPTIPAA